MPLMNVPLSVKILKNFSLYFLKNTRYLLLITGAVTVTCTQNVINGLLSVRSEHDTEKNT